MAVRDIEVYLRERARLFDSTLDVGPGSPFDVQFIQPVLRRLGTDPFTVDIATFVRDRINQAFPDLATKEGDALTDLLIKPLSLLWDPLVRENQRVRQQLSMRDPAILTTDEAEALGANVFSVRARGKRSRGRGRIYFGQPRSVSVSPANFFTSKSGLHFFPDGNQSIRMEEMLFNQEGNLYYFDVSLLAENPGVEYNIAADQLASVANIESALKVTNISRFRDGEAEESPEEFIGQAQQDLTERSLVTQRGVGAQLTRAYPEITRLGVVGFGDVDMKRDVLKGGGLGPVLAGGSAAQVVPDATYSTYSRRVEIDVSETVDFLSLIGPATVTPQGYYLTLIDAFDGELPRVRDLKIIKVVNATTVEVEEQVLGPIVASPSFKFWTLRKKSLTLSDIPGGILFPSSTGEVVVPDDEVHIGGAYDVHLRGSAFEESSLVIEAVQDDVPAASGVDLEVVNTSTGLVQLNDLVLGVDYLEDDSTYEALQEAARRGFTVQIREGVDAGSYRVLSVTQGSGNPAQLILDPAPSNAVSGLLWKLVDEITVDLVEPKETRISGNDLMTTQGTDTVSTAGGIDFDELGVATNDILRILEGPDAGDYTVSAVLAPFFNQLQLNSELTATTSNVSFTIYRPNAETGVTRPLMRVKKVELLDTSEQPLGTTIPYSRIVDAQSRAFQNPARGIKYTVPDARLGLITDPEPGGGFACGGQTLVFYKGIPTLSLWQSFTFSSGNKTAAQIISEINAFFGFQLAVLVGGDRVGFRPTDEGTAILSGNARAALFGTSDRLTSWDVRSDTTDFWVEKDSIDSDSQLDVLQVVDGTQIGVYESPFTFPGPTSGSLAVSSATGFTGFSPELDRKVEIGARSLGSARVYFIEPTSVEFDNASRFIYSAEDGTTLSFLPDPTLDHQALPALPDDATPTGNTTYDAGTLKISLIDSSQNFVQAGIKAGDLLQIEYGSLTGSVALADPVSGLVNTTLILSLDGGPDKTITFVRDDTSIATTEVTRDGVVEQINNLAGQNIASLDGSNQLVLTADVPLIVRSTGTANSLLGFSTVSDVNNSNDHTGLYVIESVTSVSITTENVVPAPATFSYSSLTYRVYRSGVQRVGTTQMAENVTSNGLYYFDVELVSEGTGDQFNIDASQQLVPTGYRSDGYYLETDDPNLTFSAEEDVRMVLSRSILENGVSDDPNNATLLSGQNIQVTYEHAPTVEDVQNFLLEETERVVCANPLAKHLTPFFVRFAIDYAGGSNESEVLPALEEYVNALFPNDLLEASDVMEIVSAFGADSITNPLDLVALVYETDRSIWAERSQNALGLDRLSAFIPDLLSVTRRTG